MLRYAITGGCFASQPVIWMERTRRWLQDGVDFIQIREKSLSARALVELTRKVMALPNAHGTKILVNDRSDIAFACGAHGVHLRDGSVAPVTLRKISAPGFLIAVSCHHIEAVRAAGGADLLVIAPVFKPLSKQDERPVLGLRGLEELARATSIPVFALGGITQGNAPACFAAGAAGVAGITLFHSPAKAPA